MVEGWSNSDRHTYCALNASTLLMQAHRSSVQWQKHDSNYPYLCLNSLMMAGMHKQLLHTYSAPSMLSRYRSADH